MIAVRLLPFLWLIDSIALGLNVSISSASCQSFNYDIIGEEYEKTILPTYATITVNGLKESASLSLSEPVNIEEQENSDFVTSGTIIFPTILNLEGTDNYLLEFNVFADEESENSVASTSTTGECSSTETTSSSFVQFPTSTEDSTAASETFSVSVQYPTSTEESYPTSETISVTSLGTTITPTPVYYGSVNSGAIETATPLEAQETDTGSPLSAEESNEKKNLKGGLSVGILGVALLLLVSFYCILVRRRKLMDEQREKLLGTQAWMTGSVVDIREAS